MSPLHHPFRTALALACTAIALGASAQDATRAEAKSTAAPVDAKAAFAQLKSFAGKWQGNIIKPDGQTAAVHWAVTGGGNTVMETQFPGTSHEMISMYSMDGNDLVITHYCAARNQPRMRLKSATADEMVFEFTGGSNMDAAKDAHIHEGAIRMVGDRMEADWVMYQDGKPKQNMRFYMKRS